MKKAGNLLLLIFFALLALVPLVTADFAGGKISETENRVLAGHPTLRDAAGHITPSALIDSTDAWIKDNVGGRKLVSDVWTRLQYHVFNRSARANDIIGKEHWIYYAPEHVLKDYTGENLLPEELLTHLVGEAETLDSLVKARGIDVRWLLLPDKKTIYPEYYPDGIAKAQDGASHTDQLLAAARQGGKLNVIDGREALMAHKGDGTLYYINVDDSHWNTHGAYIGAVELCKAFGIEATPPEQATWTEITEDRLFNGAVLMTESYPKANVPDGCVITRDDAFFDQLPGLRFADSPASYRWRTVNLDSSLPSLVYVGDSYFTQMRDYLAPYFSSVTMLHVSDMGHLRELLDLAQPGCVVFESVERMLGGVPEGIENALAGFDAQAGKP